MGAFDYHLLDVFTATPLTGNPLAVLVDQDVPEERMQAIARELNLSETVFVTTPDEGATAWPTRIFTPSTELPFAGHPTVGTAVLLASLGLVDGDAVVLAEGVGDVRVAVAEHNGAWSAELTTATLPQRVEALDRGKAAAALGLTVEQLHPDFTAAVWDCGVPYAIIGVRDVETLGRTRGVAVLDESVYAVTPAGDRWRARMFATSFGIAEDPATGSACAAFAGFVAEAVPDRNEFVVDQGVEMGRPSELRLSFDRGDNGTLTAVRVGGNAVVVGKGTLRGI
jgi:trans-2,3-dihydro-3-hydroxyanthranilate isomerase